MSLQLVAQHLAEKGRGPDSALVHMSNREVAGLQALAQRHGGELSVNPDTGLPEAGFLDNILPMVAGGALTAFTGIDPMTSAAIVGGITALDSKDLSKGLVAGLGAYGGGSLANGLLDSGVSTLTQQGIADAGGARALGAEGASAIAEDVAGQSTLAKLGAGAMSPGQTLATMGGGSMIRGGLPILAGLAPAIADAYDNQDEGDNAPEQHKGYIRKYALDPVTGQYKQVGVYEAGGDPNVDVSSKAGTAGAFGGVGQSEYQKAQGMASGGSTSDSSRIYDYLMGRGPNPMQFTHTVAPAATVTPTPAPAPITPTTPILEPVYDPYGNVQHGGQTQEQREKDWNTPQDYLSIDRIDRDTGQVVKDVQSNASLAALSPAERAMHMQDVRLQSPIRTAVSDAVTQVGIIPIGAKILDAIMHPVFGNPISLAPSVQVEDYKDFMASVDPARQAAVVQRSNEAADKTYGGDKNTSTDRGYGAVSGDATGGGYGSVDAGYRGGSEAADGGLTTLHGMEHMAHGGISGHLRPPQPFYESGKFSYKGPQVYADGGIAALAQRYDDGGMTLPMRAQPINNLGSMHPKSLQAAYDHAVATNDVVGARKYQNELGLRNKLQNPQMYADGGEAEHYNLGSYSDGGRLLKGPGDGVSDDIPATIGHGQPARLADGEFVVPARIVSELGNGSTDAGARELYKMMDRIQAGRAKTVGKDQVATNSKAVRHLPA